MTYQDLLKTNDWINLIAAFITIASFLVGIITFLGTRGKSPSQIAKERTDSAKIFRITRLIQSTQKSTWEAFRNSSIFLSIMVLGYDVALVIGLVGTIVVEKYQPKYSGLFGNLVIENNQIIFSAWMIFVLTFIIAFPILLLINNYKTELRLIRGELSRVFKWAEIEIEADYDSLLIRCFQVLSDMGARITHYNAVIGVIQAEFPRNNIMLEIRLSQNDHCIVYVSSDSKSPTVTIDFGINQTLVNELTSRLLGYR
jgi:hypothetical protein